MALQKQKFSVSFAQGVDQKSDDKQVLPGKLLELENGILTKTGKVIKRNGYGPLGNNLGSGSAITTYQDELIVFDGKEAFSYSANTDKYLSKGPLSALKIDSLPVIRNTYEQTNADSTIHPNGLQVYTWTDNRGGCRYSCIDSATGQIVISDQLISADAIKAKPVAVGNYVVILYYDTVTTTIRALPLPVLNPSSPGTVFDVAITVDAAFPNYDAALIGSRIFVAYNSTTGGDSVEVVYINALLGLSAPITDGLGADVAITVFGDASNNNVYVGALQKNDVYYFGYDYGLTTNFLPTTIVDSVATPSDLKNMTGAINNNGGVLYYTINAVNTYDNYIKSAGITSLGVSVAASVFIRSLSICGKAFYNADKVYLSTVFDTVLQPTLFVLNQSAVAVAKIAFQLAGGTTVDNMVSNSYSVDGISYLFAYTKKDLLDSVNGNVYTQTGIQSSFITFTSDNTFQEVDLGYNLHTTGGILQMYDGISFIEHNFNYYPENFSVSETGAGTITAGVRQYVVTYEWQDNQGQTHRSTTSVPLSFTSTGAKQNTVVVPTLRLTEKKGPRNEVQIVVYRTVDLGTVFYQVSSITSPTYNDTTVDTVSFVDDISDAVLIGNNFLYTNGGVVDNTQAQATNIITSFKGRICYVPAEDPYSFNYSKQTVPTTPVEFYDQQATQIDQRGGVITALAVMDDKLILFKENAIFYLTGEGPDPTGAQNDFSIPQLITTDGGCVDASSVVAMPLGLMYKSAKGIYLLNRGLNVEYVGKDVESYNGQTILSATLVANKNQVRFALNTDTAIVYDYLVQQWYTFTGHYLMVDTVSYKGVFTYLRSDGVVYIENDTFSDNGNYIKMKMKTGWFSLAGLQAFQRIYKAVVIGNYVSKHKLRIAVSYDFNSVEVADVIVDAYTLLQNPAYGDVSNYGDELVYGGPYQLYQFRYMVPRQKCESIQITIEDLQTDQIGEGYQMSSLAFEVGVKEGLNKLGSTRSFS